MKCVTQAQGWNIAQPKQNEQKIRWLRSQRSTEDVSRAALKVERNFKELQ